jgi:hypothetical protein
MCEICSLSDDKWVWRWKWNVTGGRWVVMEYCCDHFLMQRISRERYSKGAELRLHFPSEDDNNPPPPPDGIHIFNMT